MVNIGKALKRPELSVYMNGHIIGYWKVTSNGTRLFSYSTHWLNSSLQRPISLSLPLQPENLPHSGKSVEYFFENLLPDSIAIRKRIQISGAICTKLQYERPLESCLLPFFSLRDFFLYYVLRFLCP